VCESSAEPAQSAARRATTGPFTSDIFRPLVRAKFPERWNAIPPINGQRSAYLSGGGAALEKDSRLYFKPVALFALIKRATMMSHLDAFLIAATASFCAAGDALSRTGAHRPLWLCGTAGAGSPTCLSLAYLARCARAIFRRTAAMRFFRGLRCGRSRGSGRPPSNICLISAIRASMRSSGLQILPQPW